MTEAKNKKGNVSKIFAALAVVSAGAFAHDVSGNENYRTNHPGSSYNKIDHSTALRYAIEMKI